MSAAVISRIVLRYGVGAIVGFEVGSQLANDPDLQIATSIIISALGGACIEFFYALAKKKGWKT